MLHTFTYILSRIHTKIQFQIVSKKKKKNKQSNLQGRKIHNILKTLQPFEMSNLTKRQTQPYDSALQLGESQSACMNIFLFFFRLK